MGGEVSKGEGWAVASDLDALGEGYGFRKVRKELDVTAFGVNVITLPPGYESGSHSHDEQEELYFVHRGALRTHSARHPQRSRVSRFTHVVAIQSDEGGQASR